MKFGSTVLHEKLSRMGYFRENPFSDNHTLLKVVTRIYASIFHVRGRFR